MNTVRNLSLAITAGLILFTNPSFATDNEASVSSAATQTQVESRASIADTFAAWATILRNHWNSCTIYSDGTVVCDLQ